MATLTEAPVGSDDPDRRGTRADPGDSVQVWERRVGRVGAITVCATDDGFEIWADVPDPMTSTIARDIAAALVEAADVCDGRLSAAGG